MSEQLLKTKSTNFIKYNDKDDCYEWYDEVNNQLTIYRIAVNPTTVVVNIYQSPIMQTNRYIARDNLQWRKQETYGREYVRIIADYIANLDRASD